MLFLFCLLQIAFGKTWKARWASNISTRAANINVRMWLYFAFAASARFNAHRFLSAATIAFLPAAESFRFGLAAAFAGDPSAAVFEAAHLFRCPSAIAFLPAALIFRRFRGNSGPVVVSVGAPVCIARSSAIWASRCRFCSSNPRIAAAMISFVSFGVAISAFQGNSLCDACT